MLRQRFLVGGQVQGVGFRPFVYRCAVRHGLSGKVGNTSEGVEILVQGTLAALQAFKHDFYAHQPPLARMTSCVVRECPLEPEETGFTIVRSTGQGGHSVLVSPDVALCSQCRADMDDASNRRYQYPFTNCTNCGPRYTITRSIPYDRASTSMACFPQCPACEAEYENPMDRRFHAQPNACPLCGPRLWVEESPFSSTARPLVSDQKSMELALHRMAQALREGRIGAIKGLGGFHLACDALNATAIATLRERKNRPHKPLAVMVPDLAMARRIAVLQAPQERLLTSPEAPIVVCHMRADVLPEGIAPDGQKVGLMLPFTPLHVALMQAYVALCTDVWQDPLVGLVMTSGNRGGEPLCLGNREALQKLGPMADIFLLHDRDILVRADDSVVTFADVPDNIVPLPILYRRSRGFVPAPIILQHTGPCVLGMGAELKSTLCLTRDKAAFVSQHIGDLQNLETWGFYQEVAKHLEGLLQVRPEVLVCDLHPDYLSTRCAEQWSAEKNIPLLRLQHHVAHAWSVLAENCHQGPALVLALDGNGFGEDTPMAPMSSDGTEAEIPKSWGGELLYINTQEVSHKRVGTLAPLPLPGGDVAVREPWRIAQALLVQLGKEDWVWPEPYASSAPFIRQMIRTGVQCPRTSSCGRLFDAVSALLGLCHVTSYEGQAAVLLQEAQLLPVQPALAENPYLIRLNKRKQANGDSLLEMDTLNFFEQVYTDQALGLPLWRVARKFHVALADALGDMAAEAAAHYAVRHVGLSGGVLQNPTMAGLLSEALQKRGLHPLLHRVLPPNDGCISFGQAAWARAWLAKNPT